MAIMLCWHIFLQLNGAGKHHFIIQRNRWKHKEESNATFDQEAMTFQQITWQQQLKLGLSNHIHLPLTGSLTGKVPVEALNRPKSFREEKFLGASG